MVGCRFSYCALSCCSLLGNIHAVDVPRAVLYVVSCQNFDGGFGNTPGEARGSVVACALQRWPACPIMRGCVSNIMSNLLRRQ